MFLVQAEGTGGLIRGIRTRVGTHNTSESGRSAWDSLNNTTP
jgi:hypothetical protein